MSTMRRTAPVRGPAIAPMDVWEIAYGNPFGEVGAFPAIAEPSADPAAVVRELIVDALGRSPCLVLLTPENESLRLLQTAIRLAREQGLEPPLATWAENERGPGRRELEDGARSAGIDDLAVVRLPPEDLGVLADAAQPVLREHGPQFPPTIGTVDALLATARGGSLLMAQNASQLYRFWRGARLAEVLRGTRPSRSAARAIAISHAPLPVRRRALYAVSDGWAPPWLLPAAAQELRRRLVDDAIRSPATWPGAVRRGWARRCERKTNALYQLLAGVHDVHVTSVLDHARVLDALARDGGRLGYRSRQDTWDAVMPGTYPWPPGTTGGPVPCAFGERELEFAESWDGRGVDAQVFDATALRDAWRAGEFKAGVAMQAAWLAQAD